MSTNNEEKLDSKKKGNILYEKNFSIYKLDINLISTFVLVISSFSRISTNAKNYVNSFVLSLSPIRPIEQLNIIIEFKLLFAPDTIANITINRAAI